MNSLRSKSLVIGLTLAFTLGCQEDPGEYIQGTVDAETPITMPLSGTKACVGALKGLANYRSGQSVETSILSAEPKWAPGATLTVQGKVFTLKGNTGKPKFAASGDSWRWPKSEVSPNLMGWGHDHTLKTPGDPTIDHSYTHMELTERYTKCGQPLRIRAIKKGTTLQLVDTRETQGENAITFFLGLVLGFLCCLVAPIVLLIVVIVRRGSKPDEQVKS